MICHLQNRNSDQSIIIRTILRYYIKLLLQNINRAYQYNFKNTSSNLDVVINEQLYQ